MSLQQQNILNQEIQEQTIFKQSGLAQQSDLEPIKLQQTVSEAGDQQINETSAKEFEKSKPEPITVNIFKSKLEKATNLKNEGNVFFKNKDYAQAINTYGSGLQVLSPNQFYGATKEQLEKMAEISSILLNNMGTCYFNSYDWQRAEIFYSEAIVINPKYVKAIHKRALARFELKKYDESFADIKLAFSLDKGNQEIYESYKKILEKYNEWVKESKKSQLSFSANIFNKDSKKTDSPLKKQSQISQRQGKKRQNNFSWSGLASGMATVGLFGYTLYRFLQK